MGTPRALRPQRPDGVYTLLLDDEGGHRASPGDVNQPEGGDVARFSTDREPQAVIAHGTDRVGTRLQVEVADDFHGDVVIAAQDSRDTRDQFVCVSLRPVEIAGL